jgi:Fic family protein
MTMSHAVRPDLLLRIRGEFLELPGLRLTLAQAQRLWHMERAVCERVLRALVEEAFLRQTRDGAFVKRESL